MRKFTAYIYVPKIGTFIFASFLLKYVISEFIHNIQRLVNLNINAETVGLGARCIEIAAPVITEFIANMFNMSSAVANYHFAWQFIEINLVPKKPVSSFK